MFRLQHIQQVDLTFNILRLLLDFINYPSLVQQVYRQSLRFYVNYCVLTQLKYTIAMSE